MGCRYIFAEMFEDYGIRDPNWDGDIKYYIVRQCLGYALEIEEEEVAKISPDTNFFTKYKMESWRSDYWLDFMGYLGIQFELPEMVFSYIGFLFLQNRKVVRSIPESYIEVEFYSIQTLRQAMEFVLKYYSETDQYLVDLKLEDPDLGKYKEDEVNGRKYAYRLERAREAQFERLIKNPIYRFFHEFELKAYPRKEVRPEVINFDYTDFGGCFKPYQKYYLRYYHIYLKYRWQIRKAYNKRKAKYIGYEMIRRSIEYRQTYLRSSWHRNYRSYHDYNAWLAYLKRLGDEYDAEYRLQEQEKREERKKKPHFRRRGVRARFVPKRFRSPSAFYRASYVRRQKYKNTSMGYRVFDPPKKKYYEYP